MVVLWVKTPHPHRVRDVCDARDESSSPQVVVFEADDRLLAAGPPLDDTKEAITPLGGDPRRERLIFAGMATMATPNALSEASIRVVGIRSLWDRQAPRHRY